MRPLKGSHQLRRGRFSRRHQHYLLTTVVFKREPLLVADGVPGLVMTSLKWLESEGRMLLDSAVVMPDHLHFIAGLEKSALHQLMHSLKSYTANKLNKHLNRSGRFWQSQYHDHAIRNEEDLLKTVRYCLNNPVRWGMVGDYHEYPYWCCRWEV